jgi:hypothetical protein
VIDLYLSEKYNHHWPEIVRLSHLNDAASLKKLRAYALEASRISTQSYGLFRTVAEDTVIQEGGKSYDLKKGQEIFVNLVLDNNKNLVTDNSPPQMLILRHSLIPWKSNSIVRRVRTSIMDGVRIIVLARKSVLLLILLFCAHLAA